MIIHGVGQSDVGRTRQNNEDALFVDNELALYIVADGMGGHKGGEVASRLAIETIAGALSGDAIAEARSGVGLDTAIAQAIRAANTAIRERASSDPELSNMGCALSMVLFVDDSAIVGHVGDTRLYLRRDGVVDQLTQDHTFVGELVRAGTVPASEMHRHPHAHVLTRALGSTSKLDVDTLVADVQPGDRLLLCSDGLTAYVEDLSALDTALSVEDYRSIPESLIQQANSAGGKDNVTVVVVDVSPA
jgi:protein phosphatase